MTKRTLIISVIAVVITLTAGALQGAAPTEKPRKLIRIGSLKTIESNQEFDRNVRLLQAQRARAVELAKALETVQTEEAKEGLQKELDAMMAKLNENNKKMAESYGFSITRNYTRVIESSHIYMFVTEEEAALYEANRKKREKK